VDLERLAALRTPEGVRALEAAAELAGGDPLTAAASLRAQGVPADLAATALTQAELRRRATGKFGPEAVRMLFTRTGLEQATRRVVADRRAGRLWRAGVRTLADLGCGLGADGIAAARAGIRVYGVEADPVTAVMAAANADAAGVSDLFTVEYGDATRYDVSGVDAAFCDPARRRAGTGRRIFDPTDFAPSWEFVRALVDRVPRTVVKAAPGLDHALIPPGAEAEWVSVARDLVEATLWCGRLAEVPRRATLLTEGPAVNARGGAAAPSYELTGAGAVRAPVGRVGRFLYDPDPAVVRGHLVAEFAVGVNGVLADPDIAYVYADRPANTPFARCIAVTDALPFSLKRLRAVLRDHGVGRLEILKRGSAVDVERLRRELRLSGDHSATVVLTRVAGAPTVLIGHPAGA
jgi:SAM-dependent methyltransferase